MDGESVQIAYDSLITNLGTAVKVIKSRVDMEQRAATSWGLDSTLAATCRDIGNGMRIALDILIECGVWHEEEKS